jgi:hypothetical protein
MTDLLFLNPKSVNTFFSFLILLPSVADVGFITTLNIYLYLWCLLYITFYFSLYGKDFLN